MSTFPQKVVRKRRDRNPTTVQPRVHHWEGFPGLGWGRTLTNDRIMRLSALDASTPSERLDALLELRAYYLGRRDPISVILALFAGVAAAALAIPGIETAHWAARACFMSSMLLAIVGVIRLLLTENLFSVFFAEDIAVLRGATRAPDHVFLSLSDHPLVMYNIDRLLSYGSTSVTYSGLLFTIGVITFVVTVKFGADPVVLRPQHPGFIALSLAPPILYALDFVHFQHRCTGLHRNARLMNKNGESSSSNLPL